MTRDEVTRLAACAFTDAECAERFEAMMPERLPKREPFTPHPAVVKLAREMKAVKR